MGWSRALLGMVAAFAVACGTATVEPVERPARAAPPEDHTLFQLSSIQDFESHGVVGQGLHELKFIVVNFAQPEARHVRFLSARFYRFHDEWYWHRLLGGKSVPGAKVRPEKDFGFKTPGEATHWALGEEKLPLGLEVVEGERLYAPEFYKLALGKRPHTFGLGSIIRVLQGAGEEPLWAFKLEYNDDVQSEHLEIYFESLKAVLPPKIAERLSFVARSPHQQNLVIELRGSQHRLSPRLRLFSDLVREGATEVYHSSLTAGYLRFVDEGDFETLTSSREDILVLPRVPDELPVAAGMITAVPQTPLSHINLLAKNRDIPNVHLGGAMDHVQLRQLAHDEMPVVMSTEGGKFVIRAMDKDVYALWRRMTDPEPRLLPQADVGLLPYVRDLRAEDTSRIATMRRDVGGKAAGYVTLLAGGAHVPAPALALSTRAFVEHMERLDPKVLGALEDPAFVGSAHVRLLALEGEKELRSRMGAAEASRFIETFRRAHPRGPLAELARAGGLRRVIRDLPIEPRTLAHVTERLRARFATLAPEQGLRFRSSSNVEDLEGFNGAGLYTSSTGFLQPELQSRKGDQKKSIEFALLRTWSSFFSYSAFEERLNEGIDPLTGGMGVLIHPRFDDSHEEANGVLTLQFNRARKAGPRYDAVINVQAGSVSVTNAESGVTPEVVRVTSHDGKTAQIEVKSRASSGPQRVLSDEQLRRLLFESVSVGRAWLNQENRGVPEAQRRQGVVLDFEFRLMGSGWPARRDGARSGPKLVLKQVRPLEPGIEPSAAELLSEPIPKELLVRAERAQRVTCQGGDLRVEWLGLRTRAGADEFGFVESDFVAQLKLRVALKSPQERQFDYSHLHLDGDETSADGTALSARLPDGESVRQVTVKNGQGTVTFADGALRGAKLTCEVKPLMDHPDRLLRETLAGL